MAQEPYRSARRVFWIIDNGSSHRGQRCVERLQNRYDNLRVVHGPIHASWLNQIEIYFSIIQRKVLTPNDFASLALLADRLERFERHYEIIAKPFEWKFTRYDLAKLMQRLQPPHAASQALQPPEKYVSELMKRRAFGNVFAPLTQGWDFDWENTQTKVQVLTKASGFNCGCQVAVAGRTDADVDLAHAGFPMQPSILVLLQH